jgi:hypothetical protein
VALREFCEFWIDKANDAACCLFADDETLRTDGEQFVCRECIVAEQLRELDDENREAWTLYRTLGNRYLLDIDCAGLLFKRLTEDMDTETFLERCEQLRVIYDTLQPVKDK